MSDIFQEFAVEENVGAMVSLDTFDPMTGPTLAVRFKDPAGLVQKQGGAAGSLAFMAAPGAITSKIYDEAKAEIEKSFADRGIAAEVRIISGGAFQNHAWSNDLLTGAVIGAGGLGVGMLMWRYVLRGLFTRKG